MKSAAAKAAGSFLEKRPSRTEMDTWSRVECVRIDGRTASATSRAVPEEVAVAIVYDGSTHAVLMASPADLEDFALGFSMTERIIGSPEAIRSIEIVQQSNGIEARVWLDPVHGHAMASRRRAMAGPTGCGLCGVESLDAAVPDLPRVTSRARFSPAQIFAGLAHLAPAQSLNSITRAVHAAAFIDPTRGLVALAEDVGRHNALDKLVGRLVRTSVVPDSGFIVLTSRVSVEMAQKAAIFGTPLIVAVSAPTALAIRTADRAGLTLAAVARADAFEIFTHTGRITGSSTIATQQETLQHVT
jgi:FdhD protein